MTPTASATTDIRDPQYQALKGRIHQDLLARLNLERLTKMSREPRRSPRSAASSSSSSTRRINAFR